MAQSKRTPRYTRFFLTAPSHTAPERLDRPDFWVGPPPEPIPWGKRRAEEYTGETGVGRKRGGPRYAVNPSGAIKPKLKELAQKYCNVTVRKSQNGGIIAYTRECAPDEIMNFLWKNHAFQEQIIDDIYDAIYANLHQVVSTGDLTYQTVMNALLAGFNQAMAKHQDKLTPFNAWKFYDVTLRPLARSLKGFLPSAEVEVKKNLIAGSKYADDLLAATDENETLADALVIWFGPKAAQVIADAPFDIIEFLQDPTDYPLTEEERQWISKYFFRSASRPSRHDDAKELAEEVYRLKDYILIKNLFVLYDKLGGYDQLGDWQIKSLASRRNQFSIPSFGKRSESSSAKSVKRETPAPRKTEDFAVPRAELADTHTWLPLDLVLRYLPFAEAKGVSERARSKGQFLDQYKAVGGDKTAMSRRWIDKRESFINRMMGQVEKEAEPLFDHRGFPTRRHIALIMWAYSPYSAVDLKRLVTEREKELEEELAEEIEAQQEETAEEEQS